MDTVSIYLMTLKRGLRLEKRAFLQFQELSGIGIIAIVFFGYATCDYKHWGYE